jgi:hypothetical protein
MREKFLEKYEESKQEEELKRLNWGRKAILKS